MTARNASYTLIFLLLGACTSHPTVPTTAPQPAVVPEVESGEAVSQAAPSQADDAGTGSGSASGGADHGGSPTPGKPALVTRVIDGDTIEVRFGGQILDVRLIGVDTPETVHPFEPVECFGRAASAFTSRELSGERVRLEFDVERTDQYGRTLAYVWLDGKLFNRIVLVRGFASVSSYPPNVKYVDRFLTAARQARQRDAGFWGACEGGGGGHGGGDGSNVGGGCIAGYSPCIPPGPDVDCAGGSGDGPRYVEGPVQVTGSDPYGLDGEGDGIGCEG